MNKQRIWTGLGAFAGIFVLILDSRTALSGARDGMQLCLQTVIPSLFPFFVLSNLLTGSLMGVNFQAMRPMGRIFGLPKGTESLLIPAFLGGYPAGAQSIAASHRSGHISKETAEHLLAFCNNAGPAFLFGMIGPMFSKSWAAWALWGIHIASAWMVSIMFRWDEKSDIRPEKGNCVVTDAMRLSLGIMATVCGWVILFRVMIAFLNRWILWLLPPTGQVAVAGLLELSNGCCSLLTIESIPVRFVLSSALLAAGGLCVTMQTASAAKGLSLKLYFTGKVMQVLFSLILSVSLWHPWLLISLPLFYIPILSEKFRKNSRNPKTIGV